MTRNNSSNEDLFESIVGSAELARRLVAQINDETPPCVAFSQRTGYRRYSHTTTRITKIPPVAELPMPSYVSAGSRCADVYHYIVLNQLDKYKYKYTKVCMYIYI